MQSKTKKRNRPVAAQRKVNTLISLKAHAENTQRYGEEEEGQHVRQNPLKRRKTSTCQALASSLSSASCWRC